MKPLPPKDLNAPPLVRHGADVDEPSASEVEPKQRSGELPETHATHETRETPDTRGSNEAAAKRLLYLERRQEILARAPDVETALVTAEMRAQHSANIDRVFELDATGTINRGDLRVNHPLTDNNRVERLIDGDKVFPRLVADITRARSVVNLLGFVFRSDDASDAVIDALVDRARNGVEVNVIIDRAGMALACAGKRAVYQRTMARLHELEAAGGHVHINKILDDISGWAFNHLDHRKIVTVDGFTAYTGGMGLGKEYKTEWHDSMTRYEGDVAQQLNIDFLLRWLHLGKQLPTHATQAELRAHYFPKRGGTVDNLVARVIPQGPYAQLEAIGNKDEFQTITATYLRELRALEPGDDFWCENPYITDRRIIRELAAAAERGANVHVILPADNNHPLSQLMSRSYYGKLLNAGVHVYEWPGMTHLKTAASSRGWGADGSYNLDSLSAHHNWEEIVEYQDWREVSMMLYQLKEDASKSREMTVDDIPAGAWLAGKIAHATMAYFY